MSMKTQKILLSVSFMPDSCSTSCGTKVDGHSCQHVGEGRPLMDPHALEVATCTSFDDFPIGSMRLVYIYIYIPGIYHKKIHHSCRVLKHTKCHCDGMDGMGWFARPRVWTASQVEGITTQKSAESHRDLREEVGRVWVGPGVTETQPAKPWVKKT